MNEGTVVLECNVLGGFEMKDHSKQAIPYKGKLALPEDEYEKSSRLQEAVKHGWLVLKKNPTRRLNLTFTRKPPPNLVRALPLPQEQRPPSAVDRETLKAELLSEMLPQLMHAASQMSDQMSKSLEASVGHLTEKLQDQKSPPIEELMAKFEEGQTKHVEMIKETLQNVVVSSSDAPVVQRGDDGELFIPEVIKSEGLTANLNFEETSISSVDDAMAALRALKKGKSNESK